MAVNNEYSDQYTAAYITTPATRQHPSDWHGRLRLMYFTANNLTGGDATSDITLVKLPAGRVRLIGKMSHIYVNFTTSMATLDVGWAAYTDEDGTAVAASSAGIDDGIDVDTAGAQVLGSALAATGYTKEFESRDGVNIVATCQDVALAANDDIAGVIAYITD